ncbi:hypothetical protein ACFL33_01650 [Pseudomonadota bacterium]|jgi:hypothetical protein|nr:hypothetical protein [Xanthomonadales bacterium]
MNKFFIALLTLSIGTALLAAEGFSTLEEQMTGKEFAAAGLDKLTAQELSALNAWIRAHSLATLDPAPAVTAAGSAATEASGDRRGFKDEDDDERTTITSRIVGRFSGWDGQTVFKLENGMIWEQADKDKFYLKEVENPVVEIEPGMFGRWHLSVEGSDSECRVKRIQ